MTTSVLNDKFYIIEILFIEYRIHYYRKSMSLHRTPTVLNSYTFRYPVLDKTCMVHGNVRKNRQKTNSRISKISISKFYTLCIVYTST